MKACAIMYSDIVYPLLWTNQRTTGLKQSIMDATNNPLERFEIFKKELKKKDYKSWFDSMLNSQEFAQHLSNKLEPANMMTFIKDLVGLGEVDYNAVPTTVEIQTQEGKFTAMLFKQKLNEVLTFVCNRLISEVFSA